MIIQTIGELRALAPLLADRIANEDDLFCRDMAVLAAGKLGADVCLAAILDLVDTDFSRRLAQTLASYETEDVRPYLARWFEDEEQPHEVRLHAAWGPREARRGARGRLPRRVPPDPQGTDRFRCAQAICDINGWPFEWHLRQVERTAERVRTERTQHLKRGSDDSPRIVRTISPPTAARRCRNLAAFRSFASKEATSEERAGRDCALELAQTGHSSLRGRL